MPRSPSGSSSARARPSTTSRASSRSSTFVAAPRPLATRYAGPPKIRSGIGSSADAVADRRREAPGMSTHEQNKAVVRDCFAQASAGNFDALPGLVADDYVLHPEGVRGADGLADMVQGYRS